MIGIHFTDTTNATHMTSLANKTALINRLPRGMGRAHCTSPRRRWRARYRALGRNAGEAKTVVMKSAQRADPPMRFPPISPRLMALTRLRPQVRNLTANRLDNLCVERRDFERSNFRDHDG